MTTQDITAFIAAIENAKKLAMELERKLNASIEVIS
jgi:hypothetical protein